MGTEIAGARLLAPYFGDSTIVWANTIAVVLVALSVGYWLGGRLADRDPRLTSLCRVVLGGALLISIIPFLAKPFLGASVDAFDSISIGAFAGSLAGVLVLLAIPVMVLGSVSPWAIRLAMSDTAVEKSGEVAGRLYAVSTGGSLVGTMLSALLTIPLLGTQRTFLAFALVVAIVAVVGLPLRWSAVPIALAMAMIIPVESIKASDTGKVLYETETTHQYVRVVERPDGERRLELNEGQAIHSIYRPGEYLVGNYWDEGLVLPLAGGEGPPGRMAILGNAAGTVARSYGHFFPDTKIDAVEIDGKLSEIGREYFDMRNPNMTVHTEDARPWLRQADPVYDTIFIDAYHQPYIPFYLATKEFFGLVRDRLKPGGTGMINVGHPEGNGDLEETLVSTMEESFPEIIRDPVTDTNVQLLGGGDFEPGDLRREIPDIPRPLRPVARDTSDRLSPAEGNGTVWTDDKAPVEWLVDLSLIGFANE